MTLKQYLNNLPKTKSEILVDVEFSDKSHALWPFYFISQQRVDEEAKDIHGHHPCKKGDLIVTDGSSHNCVYDVNQEIKFTKNNILVVCRSGFKEKLTFYIQNLIPVGNLQ